MFVNRVKCTNCRNISESYDPFLDISLSIQNANSLDECFEEFFSLEKLSDEYKCEKCKKQTRAMKDIKIYKYPQYLVVHLKRFLMDPYPMKVKKMIEYPLKNL
jgi:ubiquitin C-terminal hydrolase